jgi:hypothetical protein
MDKTLEIAAFALISQIILNGPFAILEISKAWSKVDPIGADYQALIDVIEGLRPKDPLGKVS